MFKKTIQFLWRWTLRLSLLPALLLLLPKLFVLLFAAPRIEIEENVPAQPVAIVFGAGLYPDGSAGPVLRDRLQTAIRLYQAGKAKKLLMSGDNRFEYYNEPEAMRRYALEYGVPNEDIVLDYAGRRTYDTCYRAKEIFGVQSAILVTQEFHLPRAVFLCSELGIESYGVTANNRYFRKILRAYWHARELLATAQAVLDVYLLKPLPVLGEPQPIT